MSQTSETSNTSNKSRGLNRRQILQQGLALGAGLVVGFQWTPRKLQAAEAVSEIVPNAFVRIGRDGVVTVLSKHIEFGQGSYTGLATILAEELDADWSHVRVEAAPSDATRYANLAFGVQGTGGSTAIANSWMQLRQAGATARALLVEAAAQSWGVAAADITVKQGVVHHQASGQSAPFGELVDAASQLEPPAEAPLKSPDQFTLIGKQQLPRVDVVDKTDGKARFTMDFNAEGTLTALLARPPRFGTTVASYDDSQALQVKGVVKVVQVPRGVAVIAKGFWAAKKGREALKIQWNEDNAETRGTEQLVAEFRGLLDKDGTQARNEGDVAAAFDAAHKVVEAEYTFPYLAHAPMEPLDAVAQLKGGTLQIWAGAQLQTVEQMVAAATVELPPDKVQVHTELGGGSFGRRATPDADVVGEAASIARASGLDVPIKVVWTREDDIRGGRYRPLAVHRLRGALDADGNVTAWQHRIVSQSIVSGTPFEGALIVNGVDLSIVEGAATFPYGVENVHLDYHSPDVGVPVLWWRSVGHTHNAYAVETFLDELAVAGGQDAADLRKKLLTKHPRHLGVLERVVKESDWGKPLPKGRARGLAVHESFFSFVAQVVEITLDDNGMPKVERVVCAVDCGVAINPDNIAAQMEGGLGYGLGAILHNEITLEKGHVVQSNFHDYRSLRIGEMPKVETHIVASAEAPTGVGEVAVPPIGPAVANAFAALTGKRVRDLPFANLHADDWNSGRTS